MPQVGVPVSEGTLVAWRKQPGDWVEYEEPIVDISTDKIDTEVPSPAAGRLAEVVVEVGTTVDVGTVLARIATDARPGEAHASEGEGNDAPPEPEPPTSEAAAATGQTPAPATDTPSPEPAAAVPDDAPRRRYSPVVSRMAAEHGLDLSQIEGTGRGGRVRKQDVLAYLENGGAADAAAPPEPPLHIESPYRPEPPARRPAPAAPTPPPAAAPPPPPPRAPPPAPAPPAAGPGAGRDGAGGAALADAQVDRRAHEALARDRRPLHDDRRVRHERGRAPPGRDRDDGPADRRALRRRGAARVPRPQRVARGRHVHPPRPGPPRHRRLARRRRAHRAGRARRAGPLRRGPRPSYPRPRPPRPRPRAAARRRPRRHVHDHEPRPVRRTRRDADHQPAPGGDPRPRGGRQAAGRDHRRRRQRQHRDPPHDDALHVLGPPRDRRRLRRPLPQRAAEADRGGVSSSRSASSSRCVRG